MAILTSIIPNCHPQYLLIDFEIAAINTFKEIWSTTHIKGCFFHLSQSVYCLERELWHSNISKKPELKNRISDLLESSSDDGEVPIHSVRHRKNLEISLCSNSVLDCQVCYNALSHSQLLRILQK